MITKLPRIVAFVLVTSPLLAQPAAPPLEIVEELNRYYGTGKAPKWEETIKRLTAEVADDRVAAAEYLVQLLGQAQTDEDSGKAPWRATPFWGSRGENPARNLRGQIADELGKARGSSATLTVMRWFLNHEKVAEHQQSVLAAFDKAPAKDVGPFCVRLLQPPHENVAVVLAALKQIDKLKAELPGEALSELCDHYRPSIRTAARKLNRDRGGADPGPFDQAKAMQRPAIAALMTSIGALLDMPAPPDAEFVKVTTTWTSGKDSEISSTLGWMVKNDGDSWIVISPFGHRQTFHKNHTRQRPGGGNLTQKSAWEKTPIAAEAKRVMALRQKNDPDLALSERGRLTGQFQGHGASLYEVILAHWLYTAKQADLSAQIFLPALDTVYLDRHLVDMVRHRVGEAAGYRMLVAFAGDRDFKETQRLAESLVQRYPGTQFHEYAVRLAREMPKRQGDFQTLKLPTPAEWAAMKMKLTRTEQIAFLAERLRLLNCFQWGQPGGYSITERQTAEANGLSENAAWGLGRGTTHVINPYVELVGGKEGIFRGDTDKDSKGMGLTVADIPQLAPFLRDDWHILCVSFWRDFSSDRNLDSTRPLVGRMIDDLAKRKLSRVHEMSKMTDAERDKHIEKIVSWAKENAGKSDVDLMWDALDGAVKANAYFRELPNLSELIQLKDKRVGPVLAQYLTDFETKGARPNPNEFKIQGVDTSASTYALQELLSDCFNYDPGLFKEQARKYTTHKSAENRRLAAQILFAGGDIPAGRKVFADILGNGSPTDFYENSLIEVIETLLREGSTESKHTARLLFKNAKYPEIREGRVRAALVRRCGEAGIGDGYLSYIPLLDIKGPVIGNISYANGTVVGELIAREIGETLASNDPEIQRIQKMFPQASDQIAPLKDWLRGKAKAVESVNSPR